MLKVRTVMNLYNQLNVKSITEKVANEYINNAFMYLEKVGVDNERKEEIYQIVSSLVGRVK